MAIFRARPSPFYVLDEVEAALDDTNLQRLLEILAELRDVSQLIIVTHQKRTMEVADTLYGISMRGDGVSTRDQPAAAGARDRLAPSRTAAARLCAAERIAGCLSDWLRHG